MNEIDWVDIELWGYGFWVILEDRFVFALLTFCGVSKCKVIWNSIWLFTDDVTDCGVVFREIWSINIMNGT